MIILLKIVCGLMFLAILVTLIDYAIIKWNEDENPYRARLKRIFS